MVSKARKQYECSTCKKLIHIGELYIRTATPPWKGEIDADVDDEGRTVGGYINTHRWTITREHARHEYEEMIDDNRRDIESYDEGSYI